MKIAIDISPIVYGTGVSVYTRELVKNLLKLDKSNQYILFGYSLRRLKELEDFYNSVKQSNTVSKFYYLPPTAADLIWNRAHVVDFERVVGPIDIIHTSDWIEPPVRQSLKVTTIHDLTPILYPEFTHPKIVATHKRKLELVKRESDAIISVSESTKKDLIKLGFEKSKIEVIYEAANPNFKKLDSNKSEKILKKLDVSSKFALMVGTSERKNIEKTAQAFNKVREKVNLAKLYVVGEKPDNININNVEFLGRVSDIQLSALYSQADVFLYTSIYEGFGLPILEAFKSETPVVASNISSIPEIAKDAAILIKPTDIDDIASGIQKALKENDKLIKAGLRREKEFNWSENAKRTLKLYNTLSK